MILNQPVFDARPGRAAGQDELLWRVFSSAELKKMSESAGWTVAAAKPKRKTARKPSDGSRDSRSRDGGSDRRGGSGRGRGRGGGAYGGRGRSGGRSRDGGERGARTSSKASEAREFRAERSLDEPVGGVIFHCNNETIEENMERMVFGLVSRKAELVERITPGMPVFLFNYSIKELHGGFVAESAGAMNICPDAWVSAHVSGGKTGAKRRGGKPGAAVRLALLRAPSTCRSRVPSPPPPSVGAISPHPSPPPPCIPPPSPPRRRAQNPPRGSSPFPAQVKVTQQSLHTPMPYEEIPSGALNITRGRQNPRTGKWNDHFDHALSPDQAAMIVAAFAKRPPPPRAIPADVTAEAGAQASGAAAAPPAAPKSRAAPSSAAARGQPKRSAAAAAKPTSPSRPVRAGGLSFAAAAAGAGARDSRPAARAQPKAAATARSTAAKPAAQAAPAPARAAAAAKPAAARVPKSQSARTAPAKKVAPAAVPAPIFAAPVGGAPSARPASTVQGAWSTRLKAASAAPAAAAAVPKAQAPRAARGGAKAGAAPAAAGKQTQRVRGAKQQQEAKQSQQQQRRVAPAAAAAQRAQQAQLKQPTKLSAAAKAWEPPQ